MERQKTDNVYREEQEPEKEIDLEPEIDSDLEQIKKRSNKRYFWLKLQKDFFKRADVQLVKVMTNGKEILLLYLELLSESLEFNGRLMINKSLAYNPEIISKMTDTKIDLVRTALEKYEQLGWIEVLENGVIFMTQLAEMTGHDTKYALDKQRQRQAKLSQQKQLSSPPKEIDAKVRVELDNLISNYTDNIELVKLLHDFVQVQFEAWNGITAVRLEAHLDNLNMLAENDAEKIFIVRKTVAGSYKGFITLSKSEKETIYYNEKQRELQEPQEIDITHYSEYARNQGIRFWEDSDGNYLWTNNAGNIYNKEDKIIYDSDWISRIKRELE